MLKWSDEHVQVLNGEDPGKKPLSEAEKAQYIDAEKQFAVNLSHCTLFAVASRNAFHTLFFSCLVVPGRFTDGRDGSRHCGTAISACGSERADKRTLEEIGCTEAAFSRGAGRVRKRGWKDDPD